MSWTFLAGRLSKQTITCFGIKFFCSPKRVKQTLLVFEVRKLHFLMHMYKKEQFQNISSFSDSCKHYSLVCKVGVCSRPNVYITYILELVAVKTPSLMTFSRKNKFRSNFRFFNIMQLMLTHFQIDFETQGNLCIKWLEFGVVDASALNKTRL